MQAGPQNNAWASGSTRNSAIPRSTSVEYETQQQSQSKRLAAPPSRTGPLRNPPLSKSSTIQIAPDSEAEEGISQTRGRSPFDRMKDGAYQATEFLLRQRPKDPNTSGNSLTNGKDSSYEYANEETEYQANKRLANHRKNRISTDNKAYKPSKLSEDEGDDDELSDDGKRRRKKKKKDSIGGPLRSLPVISQDKRRKRRAKGTAGEGDESESDEGSITERVCVWLGSYTKLIRSHQHGSRSAASRTSAPPHSPDFSMDIEPNSLHSIPEGDEVDTSGAAAADPRGRPSALSTALGGLVYSVFSLFSAVLGAIWAFVCNLTFMFGRIFGTIFDLILNRPYKWAAHSSPLFTLTKWLAVSAVIIALWLQFQEPLWRMLPRFPSRGYTPSHVPAADISEVNNRLLNVESALASLVNELSRVNVRLDNEGKLQGKITERLDRAESTSQQRAADVELEHNLREALAHKIEAFKKTQDELRSQVDAALAGGIGSSGTIIDDPRLKVIEDRVDSLEGGVKEALELGKNSVKTTHSRWGGGIKGLTLKSSDGQDVSSIIAKLVKDQVAMYGKDRIGRRDFAQYSAGGRVIPTLTSETLEIKPKGISGRLVFWATGNGYAMGAPPVTALHHELNAGHCWPFAGIQGRLGVALSSPVYISDITIDHVAAELAHDIRSAPREMEVWGLVDGRDNVAKVKAWKQAKAVSRAEALERGESVEEEVQPKDVPKNYIRIASFTYDIHAEDNVQTFPVLPEIQTLGVDFGIVFLSVKNNWGQHHLTCLYRFRVHGEPLPPPEQAAHTS